MAYLVDGEGDVWVPSNEYAPDGSILWQLTGLMVPGKPDARGMWVPISAETIALRYGGAKIYGVGPTGTIGNAQSHPAG